MRFFEKLVVAYFFLGHPVYIDFTHIAATRSDDVTNYVTRRIYNTGLLYCCTHLIVKIDEKFLLNDGFNTI